MVEGSPSTIHADGDAAGGAEIVGHDQAALVLDHFDAGERGRVLLAERGELGELSPDPVVEADGVLDLA